VVAERIDRTLVGRDLYAILGVGTGATANEIRSAYRRLAAAHHPDRNRTDPRAERRMAIINVAATLLLDPESRRAYDRLRGAQRARQRNPARSKRRPPAWRSEPPAEWTVPSTAQARKGQEELVDRLRSWPARKLEALDVRLSAIAPEAHVMLLVSCLFVALVLIGCSRPRQPSNPYGGEISLRSGR
jgi:hypothetical protein